MFRTRMNLVAMAIPLVAMPVSAFADSIWGEFDSLDPETVPLPGEPEDRFAGRVQLGYLAASGNSETVNSNGKLLFGWELVDWRHSVAAAAIYSEDDEETTAENYRFGYKADRKLDEQNYLFGTVNWEKDEFSGFENRLTEAVGYGRRVFDTEQHTLDLEIGVGARQTDLTTGEERDETIGRLAGDYLWQFGEYSDFSQSLVVESGEENTYIESVSSITAQLLGELDLVVSYTIKRNSEVPAGLENTDSYTSVNVQYTF